MNVPLDQENIVPGAPIGGMANELLLGIAPFALQPSAVHSLDSSTDSTNMHVPSQRRNRFLDAVSILSLVSVPFR